MNEKGNVLVVLLIIIFMVTVAAIGICIGINMSDNEEAKATLSQIISKKVSIDDFKKALHANDFTISKETQKSAEMIGADEGYGFEIDGESIEVYKFDEKSKEELTKNNIEKAKSEGVVSMPSFNNMKLKAIYNKGLVLINYEEHPNGDEIVEIFKGL